MYLVDLWNVIEAFRETNLTSADNNTEVKVSALETLLSAIYCALNKRLPNSAQIDIDESIAFLYSFLVCAYDL